MTERGILFSAPMVRALLAGTKTQTRRACKPANQHALSYVVGPFEERADLTAGWFGDEEGDLKFACPYGQPGDRLWVRETWMPDPDDDGTWSYTQWAGCKGSPLSDIQARFRKPEHCIHRASWTGHDMVGWKPSIHMPRWASRILLQITDVRVERLQDISEADAAAEGWARRPEVSDDLQVHADAARDWYMDLWEQINGAGSWEANPWVWVLEFRRSA